MYVLMAVVLLIRPRGLARRRRHDDMSAAMQTRKLPLARRHLGAAAARALLDAAARRLHGARHARSRARPRRDVGELPARLHRRAVLRPRRLFRARRLWRGLRAEIPRAEHAAFAPLRHAARRRRRRGAGRAHRAPARRLFRHGDDRLRPGVLLHRLPVELAHRRR